MRDIRAGKDAQIAALTRIIAKVSPDVLLLTAFDYDLSGVALAAFAARLEKAGAPYPYRFALRPNTGLRSGLDLNGDGRRDTAQDAQGYGRFSGQGGMALLSRLPILGEEARDFSALKWVDFPGAMLPRADGHPFPDAPTQAAQRLSTTGHWDVPLRLADGTALHVLAFYATTPVFDGPEDRNGKRNHDEIAFWQAYLDGKLSDARPPQSPSPPFVIMGDANLDPRDGAGLHGAIRALLADPRLRDARPKSAGGVEAARLQGGVNRRQRGDPALDTSDWPDGTGPDDKGVGKTGPGNLRVDYVLPSRDLKVLGAGVFWPAAGQPLHALVQAASRHRLVWVDVRLP